MCGWYARLAKIYSFTSRFIHCTRIQYAPSPSWWGSEDEWDGIKGLQFYRGKIIENWNWGQENYGGQQTKKIFSDIGRKKGKRSTSHSVSHWGREDDGETIQACTVSSFWHMTVPSLNATWSSPGLQLVLGDDMMKLPCQQPWIRGLSALDASVIRGQPQAPLSLAWGSLMMHKQVTVPTLDNSHCVFGFKTDK